LGNELDLEYHYIKDTEIKAKKRKAGGSRRMNITLLILSIRLLKANWTVRKACKKTPSGLQPIQVIRPGLHHPPALIQVLRAIVGCAQPVRNPVPKLCLDRLSTVNDN
jgi:hypothetical protein